MINTRFNVISDLKTAQELWELLSPHESISEEWDFRFAYYKYFNYPLEFIACYDDDTPISLLPLQFNTDDKHLEFFGGSYFEDNHILGKTGQEIENEFIQIISKPVIFNWMSRPITDNSIIEDQKYELNLREFSSYEDYLQKKWGSKPRQNIRSQIRKLLTQNLTLEFDRFEDFPHMVQLNEQRFGTESTYLFPHRLDFFQDITKLYHIHMISIRINNRVASVGMSLLYKNTYIGLNSGTDHSINGLGKYLTLQKIEQAIQLGATLYDARSGDLGWKESFHFSKRPQYKLEIK